MCCTMFVFYSLHIIYNFLNNGVLSNRVVQRIEELKRKIRRKYMFVSDKT